MTADRIHLIRHGEVHNPHHVVYADLPGYSLSELGRRQAMAAGHHVANLAVEAVVASPLERARETAEIIAGVLGLPILTDEELTEWKLSARWAGLRWEDLPDRRPGELEAYLAHPESLDFSPEPLHDLAARMEAAIERHAARLAGGGLAVVSHQDPLHAARRRLTREGLGGFGAGKPRHGTVITLGRDRSGWRLDTEWEPEQGESSPLATELGHDRAAGPGP